MTAVTKTAQINAPAGRILEVMLDVEDHHTWQKEIEKIHVLESDDRGRPAKTKVSVSAMGQAATYTLQYSYPDADSFSCTLLEGDVMTVNELSFSAVPSGADSSTVTVSQEIKVKWPLPGFMIDQVTAKGVKDMLSSLEAKATGA